MYVCMDDDATRNITPASMFIHGCIMYCRCLRLRFVTRRLLPRDCCLRARPRPAPSHGDCCRGIVAYGHALGTLHHHHRHHRPPLPSPSSYHHRYHHHHYLHHALSMSALPIIETQKSPNCRLAHPPTGNVSWVQTVVRQVPSTLLMKLILQQ